MVTAMSFETMDAVSEKLAGIFAAYMKENRLEPGKDIFFLISADANHYGRDFNNNFFGEGSEAHERATAYDRELMNTYLEGDISPAKVKDLAGRLSGRISGTTATSSGAATTRFPSVCSRETPAGEAAPQSASGRQAVYLRRQLQRRPSAGKRQSPGRHHSLFPGTLVGFFSAGFYLQ